jgi:uncharacterized protein YndB with AHSA1/START domain
MTQIIFQREILIDAPLTHVWQLVATEEGLRQWWGNTISMEAKEGGRCEEWRAGKRKTAHWQGVVTIYTPPYQLMLTMKAQEADDGEPEFTTIAIGLEAKGEQTYVHVTQRAFEPAAVIGSQVPLEPIVQPSQPRLRPYAQLDRVPPGAVPVPIPTPSVGRIEPTHLLVSHEYADALKMWWQSRFTALAASSSALEFSRKG